MFRYRRPDWFNLGMPPPRPVAKVGFAITLILLLLTCLIQATFGGGVLSVAILGTFKVISEGRWSGVKDASFVSILFALSTMVHVQCFTIIWLLFSKMLRDPIGGAEAKSAFVLSIVVGVPAMIVWFIAAGLIHKLAS